MYQIIPPSKISELVLPLTIIAVGTNHNPISYCSVYGSTGCQWIYCTNGSGNIFVNHEKIVLKKGYGYLLFPETPYEYRSLTNDWMLDLVEFSGPCWSQILSALGMTESNAYYFHDQKIFHRNVMKILRHCNNSESSQSLEMSKICYDFLLELPYSIHHIKRNINDELIGRDNIVTKIITYLEDNFYKQITLTDISNYVGLNKNYLCTLFKNEMKRTVFTELTYIRMGHARICLNQYPEKDVKEISSICGYEDPSYFGKVFKKITGTTPEQYRRKQSGIL